MLKKLLRRGRTGRYMARLWIDRQMVDIHDTLSDTSSWLIGVCLDAEYLHGKQAHIDWLMPPPAGYPR